MLVLVIMLYSVPYWFGKTYPYYDTDFYYSGDDATKDTEAENKLFHFTMVFNTFVIMNLFNQLNCRKIGWKDVNIFDNFFNNFTFFIVLGGECAAQYFIITLGSTAFRTTSLTIVQWITCLSFGLGSLAVSAGAKFIPEKYAAKLNFNFNENDSDDALSRFT
jgi:magnesium-transporting ATPase (P-type)